MLLAPLVCLAAVALGPPAARTQALADAVAPLIKAHQGKVAVAVRHLRTGEGYFHAADAVMPTASLIKLPVLVEAFWQADEGKISLDAKLTLTKEDCVPGAGVLTDCFTPGATLTIRDAARLMITVSDNTATNLVLGQVGIPSPNGRMARLGFPNTRVNAKVYKGSSTSVDPERTKKYGLGSTTAREMVGLLGLLHAGKLASPKACTEMIGILRKTQDNEKLLRLLPAGAVMAHKTGSVSDAKTDAGILYLNGRPAVAICVLTCDNADQRWVLDNKAQLTIAHIGRAVYNHFAAIEPKPAPPAKK